MRDMRQIVVSPCLQLLRQQRQQLVYTIYEEMGLLFLRHTGKGMWARHAAVHVDGQRATTMRHRHFQQRIVAGDGDARADGRAITDVLFPKEQHSKCLQTDRLSMRRRQVHSR